MWNKMIEKADNIVRSEDHNELTLTILQMDKGDFVHTKVTLVRRPQGFKLAIDLIVDGFIFHETDETRDDWRQATQAWSNIEKRMRDARTKEVAEVKAKAKRLFL